MSELKCPFCGKKLKPYYGYGIELYSCSNLTCKGIDMQAEDCVWEELIKVMEEKQIDELQTEAEPEKHEIPVDQFAEQRRWIGKLCKFWDDDAFVTSNDWAFGILTSIDKGMQYQFCCNENCNFKHCEPVKPDDSIIYKGGNNE